jgi:hypothetical protein
MATGFLKEAIDNRGILGHMFDTLFPGTHKSHSIHGKINDDKKYKGEKKLPAIKLDYLFMLAVLFQTKSPIVIDKPIEEETLFANDIALSKESKNRTKKLIKQARKRVDDYNKADRDNPFSGMSNKQVKQKIIEQVQPTSHKEKKEIKKLEKMAAKEKKQQEKINSLEKKRI